eukprot:1995626-Ditylum_brightwellii.AAC.1
MILNRFLVPRISVVALVSITMLLIVNGQSVRSVYMNKHSASDEKTFVTKFIDRVHPLQDKGLRIQRKRNQWVRHFRIRDEPVADEHVDVIVPWHCESNEWTMDIMPEISSLLTIVLLHKVDPSDLNNPECKPPLSETLIETVYIKLPDKGPEIQSLFSFISNHYETLATHTIFLSTGNSWSTEESMPSAHKFESNAAVVNELVPLALQSRTMFLPRMPYPSNEIVDHKTNKNKMVQGENSHHADHKIFDRVKETYHLLFESNSFSEDIFSYAPSAQFLVHRDALLKKSKFVWENIEEMTIECYDFGIAMLYLSPNLFNPNVKMRSTSVWELPTICKKENPSFKKPLNPTSVHKESSRRGQMEANAKTTNETITSEESTLRRQKQAKKLTQTFTHGNRYTQDVSTSSVLSNELAEEIEQDQPYSHSVDT